MTVAERVLEAARRCTELFAGTLSPLPVPDGLTRREGTFRDAPVTLDAAGWAGGAAAFARVVTIAGPGLAIVNVLGLPAGPALPILGLDVVAVADGPVVVVADLSPDPAAGQPPPWNRAGAAFPPAGPLPAWCGRWFSPAALFTRVDPAQLPDALSLALEGASTWTRALSADGARRPPTKAAAAYCRDHRDEDPGLRLLDRMFGADWGERFKTEVLFPDHASAIFRMS